VKRLNLNLAALVAVVTLSDCATQREGCSAQANPANYLAPIPHELEQCWPTNHNINIVCDGDSVPAGYARTPEVRTFNANPYLLHRELNEGFRTPS